MWFGLWVTGRWFLLSITPRWSVRGNFFKKFRRLYLRCSGRNDRRKNTLLTLCYHTKQSSQIAQLLKLYVVNIFHRDPQVYSLDDSRICVQCLFFHWVCRRFFSENRIYEIEKLAVCTFKNTHAKKSRELDKTLKIGVFFLAFQTAELLQSIFSLI